MEDVKSILRKFNLVGEPVKSGNSYVVDIPNMEEFGKFYSALDNSRDVEELTENSLLTLHDISLNYLYKNYQISLLADNDQDTYRMVITELSRSDLEKIEAEDDVEIEVEETEEDSESEENKWVEKS